jgi:hypothetical protein
MQTYALKGDGKIRFNKSLKNFTQEQIDFMINELHDFLTYFDYIERDGNETSHFKNPEGKQLVNPGQFRQDNVEALK